jgi:hypothetical protein
MGGPGIAGKIQPITPITVQIIPNKIKPYSIIN